MEGTQPRIIAVQQTGAWSRGTWSARFEGRDSPVAYGATETEAVEKLKMHFPTLAKKEQS